MNVEHVVTGSNGLLLTEDKCICIMDFDHLQKLFDGETPMNTTRTPWFILNSPELGAPFEESRNSCQDKGVLDRKTKELLMMAVASMSHSRRSMAKHIKGALAAGATKEEVTEAILIVAVEGACSQLTCQEELCREYLT